MDTAQDILERAKGRQRESAQDILARAKQRKQQPTADRNFVARTGGKLVERLPAAKESMQRFASGEQGMYESGFQIGGNMLAGGTMDALGEGLSSVASGISKITPDVIEDPIKKGAKQLFTKVAESDFGQGVGNVVDEISSTYSEWKLENPRGAANVEAGANIAMLATPSPLGKAAPLKPSVTAGVVRRSARRTEVSRRRDNIDKLVRPKGTIKERIAEVPRTHEVDKGLRGLNRKKVVELSKPQQQSAMEIRKVPGVKPGNTILGNFQQIKAATTKKARNLENSLKGLGDKGKYEFGELEGVITNVMEKVKQHPELVGDAEKSAVRVLEGAMRFAAAEEKTLHGLLIARRKLDSWVIDSRPSTFSNTSATNGMTSAIRQVRSELNDFINARAKNLRVKESLTSQSRLLRAMDDIQVKAAHELPTRIQRLVQNMVKAVPIRNELVAGIGLLFGIGGLGAASFSLPFIQTGAIAAGSAYGAYRAVISPKMRRAIAELVEVSSKAIRKTTNPKVLAEMRADRAALIEILEQAKVQEEQPEEQLTREN